MKRSSIKIRGTYFGPIDFASGLGSHRTVLSIQDDLVLFRVEPGDNTTSCYIANATLTIDEFAAWAERRLPTTQERKALDALPDRRLLSFHEGQVWESPKGTLYTVEAVARGGQATLRVGSDASGKRVRRPWDAVIGWVIWTDPLFVDPTMTPCVEAGME